MQLYRQDGGKFPEQIPAKWGPSAKRWGKDFPRPGEDGKARKGSTGGSGLICEGKLPDGLPLKDAVLNGFVNKHKNYMLKLCAPPRECAMYTRQNRNLAFLRDVSRKNLPEN